MPVYTLVTANGKRAVLLNIFRQPDKYTVAVAEGASAELAQIRKTLPAGVENRYLLRPVPPGSGFDFERPRRDSDRPSTVSFAGTSTSVYLKSDSSFPSQRLRVR